MDVEDEVNDWVKTKLSLPGFSEFLRRKGHVPEGICYLADVPDLDALETEFKEEEEAERSRREAERLARKREEQRPLVAGGLMSVGEAAGFLGVSTSFVTKRMRSGELPYTMVGSLRRLPRKALEGFALKHLAVR
jgi:excisionase family DNA binding protein